ncbi:hypothetical protein LguiA_033455 [Lonicera macranthoides]
MTNNQEEDTKPTQQSGAHINVKVEEGQVLHPSKPLMEELEFMKQQLHSRKDFYVYNTMSGHKELFKTMAPGKVGMYICGITPYDHSHVGHARSMVAFDVLCRYLQHLRYNVTYVRNFTDVDDKIIGKANELQEDILTVSNRFSQLFLDEMTYLQCLPPTQEPRVSSHIPQIIDMINEIINNDCAYVADGSVYFSLAKCKSYGCLSRQITEEVMAGKRVDFDPRKRDQSDFALWKAAKLGEPSWESPWGHGRPGWHIECSAMSSHYLSLEFDIHGGGIDLKFPHHENEIAQSWAVCPESKVSYWVHAGSVTKDGKKMSKSDGNYVTIGEVFESYHPLALRHFLMSTHYRSPINYTASQLDNATQAIFYIYQTLEDCEVAVTQYRQAILEDQKDVSKAAAGSRLITAESQQCIKRLWTDFETKMSDDLQTTVVLTGVILEPLKLINKTLKNFKKLKGGKQHQSLAQSLIEIEKEVKKVLNILGLLSPSSYSEVLKELKHKALERAKVKEEYVIKMIQERAQSRKERDFTRADEIRRTLEAKGIALADSIGSSPDNTTYWSPCVPLQTKHS